MVRLDHSDAAPREVVAVAAGLVRTETVSQPLRRPPLGRFATTPFEEEAQVATPKPGDEQGVSAYGRALHGCRATDHPRRRKGR
jgi:hypothetical protein